jgi:hypothetical protein
MRKPNSRLVMRRKNISNLVRIKPNSSLAIMMQIRKCVTKMWKSSLVMIKPNSNLVMRKLSSNLMTLKTIINIKLQLIASPK